MTDDDVRITLETVYRLSPLTPNETKELKVILDVQVELRILQRTARYKQHYRDRLVEKIAKCATDLHTASYLSLEHSNAPGLVFVKYLKPE